MKEFSFCQDDGVGKLNRNMYVVQEQTAVVEYRDGEKRNAIIAAMSKPTKDGFWELQRDYVLASPSTAASYCSGRSCNGWLHWINDAGQSLDELYRSE